MAAVHTIGAHAQAGEIPGNGCLAVVTDTKDWIFQGANANEVGVRSVTYRLGVTLDHLMEMYWRWKTVQVTVAGVDNLDSGVINVTKSNTRSASSEAALVLPASYYKVEFGFPYYCFKLFNNKPAVRHHNGLYYPSLAVSYHKSELVRVDTKPTGNIPGPSSFFGSVTMADGTVYNLPMIAHNISNPVVNIQATEYWPHEKPDGTPKYSITTGARL